MSPASKNLGDTILLLIITMPVDSPEPCSASLLASQARGLYRMAHHIRSMPISYILAVDAHRTVGRGQVELAPIGDRGAQHYPGVVYVCSDTGYELDTLL